MDDRPTRTGKDEAILALPTPYYLFRLLTGSDHLHFGYFRSDQESVGQAQQNMMWLNLFFRPRELVRVADVGCGLGATAKLLATEGCQVVALCPDEALIRYAKREPASGRGSVRWHTSTFEAWNSEANYDFTLFQESFQYIADTRGALQKVFMHTVPGGRLVMGDQFLNERRPREAARFHFTDDILQFASDAGFRLSTACDISGGALQTTRRMLDDLRTKAGELIANYRARRPSIEGDIETMLYWGTQELGAFEGGLLSYRILVFDRPK